MVEFIEFRSGNHLDLSRIPCVVHRFPFGQWLEGGQEGCALIVANTSPNTYFP